SSPRVIAYTTEDPSETGKAIFSILKNNPETNIVKYIEGNTDIKVVLEPNFAFRILILSTADLKSVPLLDERVLYQDKSFSFPEYSEKPEILLNTEVYEQLLAA